MTGSFWALLSVAIGVWVLVGLFRGRRRRAVQPLLDVVETYRRLARIRPKRYAPGFAGSLYALSLELGENGAPRAALAAIQEAVDIYRLLARQEPDRYAAALEESLAAETRLLEVLGVEPGDIVRAAGEDHYGDWAPFGTRRPIADRFGIFVWSVALVSVLMSSVILLAVAAMSGGLPF